MAYVTDSAMEMEGGDMMYSKMGMERDLKILASKICSSSIDVMLQCHPDVLWHYVIHYSVVIYVISLAVHKISV